MKNKVIRSIRAIKNNFWIGAAATILAIAGCAPKQTRQYESRGSISIPEKAQRGQAKRRLGKGLAGRHALNPRIKMQGKAKAKEQHTITVWIHGTRFAGSSDFLRKKVIKNILYRFYIKKGLHHGTKYKKNSNFRIIAQNLAKQETSRFKSGNFYIFGWTGELSIETRKSTAKKLHKALVKLMQKYEKKHGVVPKIRLITHSHGGNVALHFAKVNDKSAEKITISELILLACPVQKKTAHLVTSKTFKKIYSIYSGVDIVQVLDPQGLHTLSKKKKSIERPFFSERVFTPQKNLTQVKIKINRRSITHLEFILTRFATLLPHILKEIDDWTKTKSPNTDPQKQLKLLKISTGSKKPSFTRKILKK